MEKETFFRLLKKYRNGDASEEEIRFLHTYYRLLDRHEDPLEGLDPAARETLKTGIRSRLEDQMEGETRSSGRHLKSLYGIRRIAAAIALLITFSAGFYLFVHHASRSSGLTGSGKAKADIAPGGNKARLTLADGRSIVLEDASSGVLTSQGFTEIIKPEKGMLVYSHPEAEKRPSLSNTGPVSYNTISTPQGGQFMIVLPDGSKVWLNSASSLKFPVSFTGNERLTELSGEAYFEVARNPSKPFKVKAGDVAVEVLGTHFNINSYEDEETLKATLLEGSIMVSIADRQPDKPGENLNSINNRKGGNRRQLLQPGQQARIGRENSIQVAEVNTEEIVAWKNGYFMFNNESLESIMRKISKWYNVEVEYSRDPGNLHFGGMVSRSKNISSVLKIMELTGNVQFKIIPAGEGKKARVQVML